MLKKAKQEYAGFLIRFFAKIIDMSIIFFGLVIVELFAILIFGFDFLETMPSVVWILALLFFVTIAIYDIIFIKLKSATPGMNVVGIKVVRIDGKEISWATSIARRIFYKIGEFFFFIGIIFILFDDKKQGLHDKVVNTYVVKA